MKRPTNRGAAVDRDGVGIDLPGLTGNDSSGTRNGAIPLTHAHGPSTGRDVTSGNGTHRTFVPGKNPRGELSLADWRYLLPAPPQGRVLVIGVPSPAELGVLTRTAEAVVVASTDRAALAGLRSVQASPGGSIHLIHTDPAALPFPDHTFSLVLSEFGEEGERWARMPGLADQLNRLTTSEAAVLLLTDAHGAPSRMRRLEAESTEAFPGRRAYWIARRNGGLRMALPLGDHGMIRYFFDQVLYGTSRRGRWLRHAGRAAARLGIAERVSPGRALLLHRRKRSVGPDGPTYLVDLAARNGFDMTGRRTGFFARGDYDSNKVTFFLFRRHRAEPDVILKVTRTPLFNDRLEREHRALVSLARNAWVSPDTHPQPVFLDRHDGLAVLAQSVVDGAPFRVRTRSHPSCPLAARCVDWITDLGAASVVQATSGQAWSDRLMRLFTRFEQIYPLDDGERDFLAGSFSGLADCGPIPAVFRHGDAGTWNVLATPPDGVVFLDWEASDAQGPPLWDLFDFLRSFGAWIARVEGGRDRVANSAYGLVRNGALMELRERATRSYCDRVGVPEAAVAPLFYACWMERALREAEWHSGPLDSAAYFNLLRQLVRERPLEVRS